MKLSNSILSVLDQSSSLRERFLPQVPTTALTFLKVSLLFYRPSQFDAFPLNIEEKFFGSNTGIIYISFEFQYHNELISCLLIFII